MAKLNFVVCSVVITLALTLSLCDANDDDNPKIHIVYLGSLPETTSSYSPTSHHLNLLQQLLDGSNPTRSLVRSYKRSFNGFAAMLTNQQAAKLTQMEAVVSVFPSKTLQTQTTRSWDFLGLPKAPKGHQTIETNLVVGVFDTGVWPESESFSDKGIVSPVPKNWKGRCAGGKNFTCNKKLIGARFYTEDSARDNVGHGSHTASTAAGNTVDNTSFYGIAQGTARGAVPSSRITAYKVCSYAGCEDHAILAAFDDAIADGVDVISVSLGGNVERLEADVIAIGSFHAMVNGVLVVNSAGNRGPYPGTVTAVAPWILTVAANTMDRQIVDKVILGNGKVLTGIPVINAFESNGRTIPIALSNGNASGCVKKSDDQCLCLDKNLVKGKIILCDYFQEEVLFSGAVGAVGKAYAFDDVADITAMPSVSLLQQDYDIVKFYKNSTKDPTAEILKSESAQDHSAPKAAAFSSRGPNTIISEILKPDVSAPGVNILAAYSPISPPTEGPTTDNRSVNYSILSGTSMACPHVSGIAAYVKSFHPNWSPAAVKSAIMTSAKPMVSSSVKEVGEYAYGCGQANPVLAINPGLVYDINKGDYVQMLCNLGYDSGTIKLISGELNNPCKGAADRSLVRNLNYPAFAIEVRAMVPFNVSFGRIVTNVGLANSSYRVTITPYPEVNITVTPTVLSFKELKEKKSFQVNVIGNKIPSKTVVVSSIVWSDGTYHVRSPIVVDVSLE